MRIKRKTRGNGIQKMRIGDDSIQQNVHYSSCMSWPDRHGSFKKNIL